MGGGTSSELRLREFNSFPGGGSSLSSLFSIGSKISLNFPWAKSRMDMSGVGFTKSLVLVSVVIALSFSFFKFFVILSVFSGLIALGCRTVGLTTAASLSSLGRERETAVESDSGCVFCKTVFGRYSPGRDESLKRQDSPGWCKAPN